jgi:hypothetical protein
MSTSGQPTAATVFACSVVNLDARSQTSGVTSGTKKVLEDALALLKEEREALVEALRDSLDPETVELSNASHVPIVASNAHSGSRPRRHNISYRAIGPST